MKTTDINIIVIMVQILAGMLMVIAAIVIYKGIKHTRFPNKWRTKYYQLQDHVRRENRLIDSKKSLSKKELLDLKLRLDELTNEF